MSYFFLYFHSVSNRLNYNQIVWEIIKIKIVMLLSWINKKKLNSNFSCCSCALNMLLSVICIVLVIAAVVAAGIYFGVIDKEKGFDGNLENLKDSVNNGVEGVKNQINKFHE